MHKSRVFLCSQVALIIVELSMFHKAVDKLSLFGMFTINRSLILKVNFIKLQLTCKYNSFLIKL